MELESRETANYNHDSRGIRLCWRGTLENILLSLRGVIRGTFQNSKQIGLEVLITVTL